MSVRSMTDKHVPTVSVTAGAYTRLGDRKIEFAKHIAATLALFERDPVAKAEFLARIPTRRIFVSARTAARAAKAKLHLHNKTKQSTVGLSLQVTDDAINRALDKAEAKAAKRSRR
jgi:hypothetical protein